MSFKLEEYDKDIVDLYHPLQDVYAKAIAQVTDGKGYERHGKGYVSFMDQPWVTVTLTHGVGFLTGQAAKKLAEAQQFTDHAKWEAEMLGALNYAAMAILFRAEMAAPGELEEG